MDHPMHSVSVAGVIVDDEGRALVVRRRDNGRWEPPGGVLELTETIQQGLRREIREETGLDVEIRHLTGVYKNMSRGIVALVFRCSRVDGDLTLNPEVTEFRWMRADEVRRELDGAYAIRVADALTEQPARIRAHDGRAVLDDEEHETGRRPDHDQSSLG